jgi:integrase
MRKHARLHRWDADVTAYLCSRRALGRRYSADERILSKLRAFLAQARAHDLDRPHFDAWLRQFGHCIPNTRVDYGMRVQRFCRYRRRVDPACFVPDRLSLGRSRPHPLPSPIEPQQVAALLEYLDGLPRAAPLILRVPALRLAIVLLFTTGIRRGEAARLTLGDVDADAGVLRIRASKFHKSRWVPLSTSATDELRAYLKERRAIDPHPAAADRLLCSCAGRSYTPGTLSAAVKNVMTRSGAWADAPRLPRVHDFRHGFAVAVLRRWYETEADAQAHLPHLALYMGHVSIDSTACYLRYMPAVVELASDRFRRTCGDVIDGGAP